MPSILIVLLLVLTELVHLLLVSVNVVARGQGRVFRKGGQGRLKAFIGCLLIFFFIYFY